MFILLLLFIIVISFSFFLAMHFSNAQAALKKQILLISHENINLRNNIAQLKNENKNIVINYVNPNCKKGVVSKISKVYCAPIESSPLMDIMEQDTTVTVLDCALVEDSMWYYIMLQKQDNINSKGWTKKENLFLVEQAN